MVKRHRVGVTLAVIAIVFAVIVGYFQWLGEGAIEYLLASPHFLVYGLPSEKYLKQAVQLEDAVKPLLPQSQASNAYVAVEGRGGESGILTNPNELDVYNVPERADQDNIIAAVRNQIRSNRMIAARVDFYDTEGRKAGGRAKVIRSVRIR